MKHLSLIALLVLQGPACHAGSGNSKQANTREFTDLHEAVRNGKSFLAEGLIIRGASLHARDEKGATPLHYSTSRSLAEMLVRRGAKVTARSDNHDSPIHYAARNRELTTLIDFYLEQGANINAQNKAGDTPLHVAAREYNHTNVVHLLKSGANVLIKNKARENPYDVVKEAYVQFDDMRHTSDALKRAFDLATKNSSKTVMHR